jgi:hypothetical protein
VRGDFHILSPQGKKKASPVWVMASSFVCRLAWLHHRWLSAIGPTLIEQGQQ